MPTQKFMFSEPFASQLERALNGYSPNKAEPYIQKAMNAKPPSEKQCIYLRNLGYQGEMPTSMRAVSELINTYKRK